MSEPRIFLTFDDGPDPEWTPRVLDALEEADARATFFVISPRAALHPDVIRRTLDLGHRVELHCADHIRHTERTQKEVERDTREGLEVLRSLGARPRLWRPPWGVLAPWTGEVAEQFGLELALWNVDTHDWRGDGAPEMLERISPELAPGSTVLMHDGIGPGARRSGCANTAELVGPLVGCIRSLGCEPATLGTSVARGGVRA